MENQSSLTPANIYVNATQERFQDTYRRWQGIPSIEVSPAGRIFVNFYSGQDAEVGGNIMMLCVSDDNGETWPYTLLLDERNEVSYPDAKEADNGYIYVTYDWERVTQREILMARFTEDDILRGKILSPEGKLRVLVNKALGQPDIH